MFHLPNSLLTYSTCVVAVTISQRYRNITRRHTACKRLNTMSGPQQVFSESYLLSRCSLSIYTAFFLHPFQCCLAECFPISRTLFPKLWMNSFPSFQILALNRSLKRVSIKELRFILQSGNNLFRVSPIKSRKSMDIC